MQNQIQTLFSDRKNSLVHLVTESESMGTNRSCRLTITLCEGDWSPAEVVQGDWGIFIFKGHLDTVLCNMLCVALLEEGSWTRWTPEGPFGHQPFCGSVILWTRTPLLWSKSVKRRVFMSSAKTNSSTQWWWCWQSCTSYWLYSGSPRSSGKLRLWCSASW